MTTNSIYEGCNKEQRELLDIAIKEDDLGNINKAKELYLHILEINDEVPYVHAMLGGLEFDNENYNVALIYFEKAILLKPNSPGAIELRGECKEYLCRYKEAVQDYNLAIELKPDFAKAYFRKGMIFHYEGNKCKKKEYYHIAYECIKKAKFYNKSEYTNYYNYFKRKIKYLQKIGLY